MEIHGQGLKEVPRVDKGCLGRILKVMYRNRITNQEILLKANSRPLDQTLTMRRIRLPSQILRLAPMRRVKVAMN